MRKIVELCPYCDEEVKIKAIPFVPQKCPNCGHTIRACGLCDCDVCDCDECQKKFPKENEDEE